MQHFKWTLIMSMLTLIFLIPAHGAKAANGPAEGEGGYAYIGFADYENEKKSTFAGGVVLGVKSKSKMYSAAKKKNLWR